MAKRPMSDVVVLLPGILGSVLTRDDTDVWALSGGATLRALLSLGRNIAGLALEEDPPDVDDLGDGVTATRLMPDTHLIPGLWKIDGYSRIESALMAGYTLERGANYFAFPYDWRRDNRVHAARLARESAGWLAQWRERSGNNDAKLVLIGHSMGGLVARYFLEVLDGWRDTRTLITFGTPFRGSVNAVDFLANGIRKGVGPLKLIDLTDLVRSFTSVHQLLPDYACLDAGGELVPLRDGPAITGIDPARLAAAVEFHAAIAEHVQDHADDDDYQRARYAVHPIVGINQPTLQSARLLDGGKVQVLRTYEGEDTDGDGTVPKQSATPTERVGQGNEMFAADRHSSLQNADPVLVQLDGLLRQETIRFKAAPIKLGLDLDDLYEPDEPATFAVRADQPGVPLTVAVTDRETGAELGRAGCTSADGEWQPVELPPLPTGTYRVRLEGTGLPPADPVHDVFVVFGASDEARAVR